MDEEREVPTKLVKVVMWRWYLLWTIKKIWLFENEVIMNREFLPLTVGHVLSYRDNVHVQYRVLEVTANFIIVEKLSKDQMVRTRPEINYFL